LLQGLHLRLVENWCALAGRNENVHQFAVPLLRPVHRKLFRRNERSSVARDRRPLRARAGVGGCVECARTLVVQITHPYLKESRQSLLGHLASESRIAFSLCQHSMPFKKRRKWSDCFVERSAASLRARALICHAPRAVALFLNHSCLLNAWAAGTHLGVSRLLRADQKPAWVLAGALEREPQQPRDPLPFDSGQRRGNRFEWVDTEGQALGCFSYFFLYL